jgi:hypothetical protein
MIISPCLVSCTFVNSVASSDLSNGGHDENSSPSGSWIWYALLASPLILKLTNKRCGHWYWFLLRILDDVHIVSSESLHAILHAPIRRIQYCISLCQAWTYRIRHCFSLDLGCHLAPVIDRGLHIRCRGSFLVCSWSYCTDSHVLDPCMQGEAECAEMSHVPRDRESEIRYLRSSSIHAVRIRHKHLSRQSTSTWWKCSCHESDGNASIRCDFSHPSRYVSSLVNLLD